MTINIINSSTDNSIPMHRIALNPNQKSSPASFGVSMQGIFTCLNNLFITLLFRLEELSNSYVLKIF